jgi:hypothetical protein
MKKQDTVSIYFSGVFGVSKIEGKVLDFGLRKYAQYEKAPFVNYIKKGKRKVEGFIKGYKPYLVILEGINTPSTQDPFTTPTINENGVTTKMSKFSSFDDRYILEFDEVLNEYIKNNPASVIMDCRFSEKTELIY